MTVKELKEHLQKYPDNKPVGILVAWPDRRILLRHKGLEIFKDEGTNPKLALEVAGAIPFRADENMAGMDPEEILGGENKPLICDWLLATLVMTRNLSDLRSLEYRKDTDTGEETVTASFDGGGSKIINVTADSGTAMIRDIMKNIE